MKRGIATFTLDTGRCPRWLFERMVKLAREITIVIVTDFGPQELLSRAVSRSKLGIGEKRVALHRLSQFY